MKATISIYVDADINQRATEMHINKSAICNEALKLATMKLLPNEEGNVQTALGNFLRNKVEEDKDLMKMRKEFWSFKRAPNRDKETKFRTLLAEWCKKYTLTINEAMAKLDGREI